MEPSSADDNDVFHQNMTFDVKGLVGDAVGNMSISPYSRDLVLAARRGLFIIDLDAPYELPRFLPQGGTWDVADVQWNPHKHRSEYIVSTSSEKLLIWNLELEGNLSIQHRLHAHYRAITDINWHWQECDIVCSTGIDSWIWAWDLRVTRKPIFGLSAFGAGGTQVKWNRVDGNLLASSQANEALIWDRRKGSVPVHRIRGHDGKIYGIDWSPTSRTEIMTCSLDKTIKIWDTNRLQPSTINAENPIWRARYLPFGDGILSMAQRGEDALQMIQRADLTAPPYTFEGHTDVVKEFVWRRNSQDEFQLITWSKDRTLRLWPIEDQVLQRFGHTLPAQRVHTKRTDDFSYRNLPARKHSDAHVSLPQLTAPVGHRTILAEVRANPPSEKSGLLSPALASAQHKRAGSNKAKQQSSSISVPVPATLIRPQRKRGFMSRGNVGGRSRASRLDHLTWVSSVRVEQRGTSSGRASSSSTSADRSRSRSESGEGGQAHRSSSHETREHVPVQSLQDEITTVLSHKLGEHKIRLEKIDLTKKRMCTVGLVGPWGESSSVFIRATFTFPKDYPQGKHPDGTPSVELDRTPLVSIRTLSYILKHLRGIRQQRRPCFEACLRFLLFGGDHVRSDSPDSESSSGSDDAGPVAKESKVSAMRNNKNLAEPRTCQGTFGPNGELVYFRRAAFRYWGPTLRPSAPNGLDSPSPINELPDSRSDLEPGMEVPVQQSKSPVLMYDAVQRLRLASSDHKLKSVRHKGNDDDEKLTRVMMNLLISSPTHSRESGAKDDISQTYVMPLRRSNISLFRTSTLSGSDSRVAMGYIFASETLGDVCKHNANVAARYGRSDHQRAFVLLGALFAVVDTEHAFRKASVADRVIMRLYGEFAKDKDVQMLAMLSTLILQSLNQMSLPISGGTPKSPALGASTEPHSPQSASHAQVSRDYFASSRSNTASGSQSWLHSPTQLNFPLNMSSSNSSKGSWSSLLNPTTVRQMMATVQDSFKDGFSASGEVSSTSEHPIPVPRRFHGPDSPDARDIRTRSSRYDLGLRSPINRPLSSMASWSELPLASHSHPTDSVRSSMSSSSMFSRRLRRSSRANSRGIQASSKQITFVSEPSQEERPNWSTQFLGQLRCHIYVYAEFLYRWQLYQKRLELLKSVNFPSSELYVIGVVAKCTLCGGDLHQKENACRSCGAPSSMPSCVICRLPIEGLSKNCFKCMHTAHLSCWRKLNVPICPSGCACICG
ncbi:hypothetical protein FISHEDRAFT_52764 [Fistulina hepatica ATCC 64428]|nr:hypothetical protein FISHEDRAFT_52764 [Fistulina hepatica ATCC 64428]